MISFEFFPPKTPEMTEKLAEAARDLSVLNPSFVTVTFGAGGSTKDGTFETARTLQSIIKCPVGAHISYFGTRKEDLFAYTDDLWKNGIQHLVALRGDIPVGTDMAAYASDDYFHYTSDFVEALLTQHPFDISVGAYPEKHPDAPSLDADIIALKKKCDAGAARAITQFFFGPNIYKDFCIKVRDAGIKTPIVPGLLPIADFEKAKGFAGKCGASIPDDLENRFSNAEPAHACSVDLLAEQIQDLELLNVEHLHFYSLNRADLILSAYRSLGRI